MLRKLTVTDLNIRILTNEIWKAIVGYEGLYEVSDWGRIKSLFRVRIRKDGTPDTTPERIRKFYLNNGYPTVVLYRNGRGRTFTIHRIVLEAFVGPCPEGMECRHLDDHRANVFLSNLCWATKTENEADKERHGTRIQGSKHYAAELTESVVSKIVQLYETGGYSQGQLAKKFGTSQSNISHMLRKKSWKHVPRRSPPPNRPDGSAWTASRGVRNGRAKITETDVKFIRNEYQQGNCTQEELGRRFGVSQFAISAIIRRKLWKHVQ